MSFLHLLLVTIRFSIPSSRSFCFLHSFIFSFSFVSFLLHLFLTNTTQACWKVNPQDRPSIQQVIDDLCVVIDTECGEDEKFLSFVHQQRDASRKEEEDSVFKEVTRKEWKKGATVRMPDSKMETTHRPKCMCVAGPCLLFSFCLYILC